MVLECSFRLSPKGAEDSFRRPLDCLLDVVVDQNQVRLRVIVRVRVRVNLWFERINHQLERDNLWLDRVNFRFERVNLRLKLYLFRLDIVVDVVGSVGSNFGLDVIGSGARRC